MVDRSVIERDLDEFVEGETWPIPDPDVGPDADPVPASLPDQAAVQGVLRRLKRLDRERQTIVDVAKCEVERITMWKDDRVAGIDRDIAWGERALEIFARQSASTNPRAKKSIPLPDGTLKLSKPQGRVIIADEEAFTSWAVEGGAENTLHVRHPDLVRITIEPNKNALKALDTGSEAKEGDEIVAAVVLAGGELVPGVEVHRPAVDRFNVTLSED